MRSGPPPLRPALVCVVASALLLGGGAAAAGDSPASLPVIDVAAVDQLLKSYAEQEVFSGEALVALGDQVLLHQRYGYDDWPTHRPLPESGIYKIGSVTKQFTAAALLRLEAQGRLAAGDALARHIPELPPALLGRDGQQVTLHHLLTHTSGFPDPLFANVWGPEQGFDALLAALRDGQLRHPPGAHFRYNNTGYALLGEVIRRAAGCSYEQYLRRELFEPLGMRATGIKPDPEQRARLVHGHVSNVLALVPARQALGRFVTGSYDWDLFANGSVFSSVTDLHRWLRALQRGELFDQAQMTRLLTPEQHDYAYGWVRRSVEGLAEPLYWHNGAIIPFGFTADVGWTRGSELCVIVLSNLDDSAVAQNLFANVVRTITGTAVEETRAGFRANGSYLTIQLVTLAVDPRLLAAVLAAYLLWLLLRRHRSRLQLYGDIASAVCMAILVAAVIGHPAAALGVALAVGLGLWAAWRARRRPLLHTTPARQWSAAAGAALSNLLVLAVAVFILWYF